MKILSQFWCFMTLACIPLVFSTASYANPQPDYRYRYDPLPTMQQKLQIMHLIDNGEKHARSLTLKKYIQGAASVIQSVTQLYACDTRGRAQYVIGAWLSPRGSLKNVYSPYFLANDASPRVCLNVDGMNRWSIMGSGFLSVHVVYAPENGFNTVGQTLLFSDDNGLSGKWLFFGMLPL